MESEKRVLRVQFWVFIENLYDGSATARFFKTQADAEKYAEEDDERFCDDIFAKELLIDAETGELLNPHESNF
jgi:hypothetical protein